MLDETRVWDLLRAIERGEVTVTCDVDPWEFYCGDMDYRTNNGWTLTVFNDCAEWDYLSAAESPEGETILFEQMSKALQDYEAPEDDWFTKWGFR